MGRIYYSLSGEGRGHATRARTLLDRLLPHHEVRVFTFGDAIELLGPFCQRRGVDLVRIPGLRFSYGRGGRLDYLRTVQDGLSYALQLPRLIGELVRGMRKDRPDLVITDFEPALPRAAAKLGVPYVSVDHQHFLSEFDLSALPPKLRRKASFIGLSVPLLYARQVRTIVSAFYRAPLRRGARKAESVGVLLDEEIRSAIPSREGHLTAYLRRKISGPVLEVLENAPLPVHVFGLGEAAPRGALRFEPVTRPGFVRSMASAEALITTAGNQVIGEAFALGKPVLAIPEPGNFEQEINAWFLADSGAGVAVDAEHFDTECLRRFLGRLDDLRRRVQDTVPPGNERVIALIEQHLPGGSIALATAGQRMARA